MEAKETSYKEVLKTNLGIFLCYTILIAFIFLIIGYIIKCTLNGVVNTKLSIVLSIIVGILIYHISHFICRSSTIESFKKSKLNVENTNLFLKQMNLFFVACAIISVIICIEYLVIDNQMHLGAIAKVYEQYEFISPEFADRLANSIRDEYSMNFLGKTFSTIIIELSCVISSISLIKYQKDILKKYNK